MTKPIPIKAVIIDDERHCRDHISDLLNTYCPEVEVAASCATFTEAIHAVHTHAPDLLFMDVEMPEGSGFDLLEQLGSPGVNVIFTTAHQQYAILAIRANAVDYLLKPVLPAELKKAIKRMREIPRSNSAQAASFHKISLPTLKGLVFCDPDDIIRCEADGAYTKIHMVDGSMVISRNISVMEEVLQRFFFFRVHKSHLINLHHLEEYIRGNGGIAIMSDGAQVEVSKRRRDDFLDALI